MQVNKIDIREEIKLIKEQFKKTEYGFINILDNEDSKFYSEQEAIEETNKKIDALIAMLGNDYKEIARDEIETYESSTRTTNKKSKKPVKNKRITDEFDVVIRENKKVVFDMDLSFNERAVYRELCALAFGKENMVCIEKEIPTLKQLSEIIGKKERTLTGYFQKLEEKRLIHREPFMHKNIIYINPLYYRTYLNLKKLANIL